MKNKFLIALLALVSAGSCAFGLSACDFGGSDEVSDIFFELTASGQSYCVVSANQDANDIVIPSTYKKLPVTEISSGAFRGYSNLTSITIPDSITSIGRDAFMYCSSLTSVTLGDGVTTIDDGAFYGCSRLASIAIPNSVTAIGGEVFVDCSCLMEITIPDSVTTIGLNAFDGCSSLKEITIPDSITDAVWQTFEGCDYIEKATIPAYVCGYIATTSLKTLVITSGDSIDSGALARCSNLTSVTIPDSVTTIGDEAFDGCSSLTEIAIPEGLTSIGEWAFASSGLTSITIPDSVTTIGRYAFMNCSSLTGITIPDGVTTIDIQLFSGCSGLTSVTIGDGVTTIEDLAFDGCSSLTAITVPEGVTSIGFSAFGGCSSLESITLPFAGWSVKTESDAYQYPLGCLFGMGNYESDTAKYYEITQYIYNENTNSTKYGYYYIPTSLKNVTITGGNIVYGAFYHCSGLTNITLGDGVTSIGDKAFSSCSGLTEITIPDSVTSIGDGAFQWCSSLTTITLGDGVTSIGAGAFYFCSGLTSIIYMGDIASWCGISGIENLQAYVASGLYINNQKLTGELVIPDGVTSIGDAAFYGCSGLTSITIPEGVTSIGYRAFLGCSSLTSVTIPDSVTTIGDAAFYGCSGLTSFIMPESVTSVGNDVLGECDNLQTVSVPANCLSGLPDSLTKVTVTGGEIAENAFVNFPNVTELVITDNVTSIAAGALRGLGKLEKLTTPFFRTKAIPGVLGMMFGVTAFAGASATNQIISYQTTSNGVQPYTATYYIPDTLTSVTVTQTSLLTAGAFSNCIHLKEIYHIDTPDATYVNPFVFYGCTALETVMLSSGIRYIESYAFYGCASLKTVYCIGSGWSYDITVYTGNDPWNTATGYFYSETQPTGEGNYWHYDENGEIVVW